MKKTNEIRSLSFGVTYFEIKTVNMKIDTFYHRSKLLTNAVSDFSFSSRGSGAARVL